jgi:hypothetical protein
MSDIRLWSVFLLLHVNLAADLIDMESLSSLTAIFG